MNDAARSAKQNIQEGYKQGSLGEYINYLNISCGSWSELRGDIELFEDGLITNIKNLICFLGFVGKRIIY